MPVTIADAVARIEAWQGLAVEIKQLSGGLTNSNYQVTVDGVHYVVRIGGASGEMLGLDRHREVAHTRQAAAWGLGPRVLAHFPDLEVLVLEHLAGRTLSAAALREPDMPRRLGAAIRLLHGGGSFAVDFDMWTLLRHYRRGLAQLNAPEPVGFADRLPQLTAIETTLAICALPQAPCHNDLLAENLIDDGHRLRIIDFEYSGNNDPAFDLGNSAQEQMYDDAQIDELCGAYFGADRPEQIARVKLNQIVSDAVWSLWAAIQQRISLLDFDYAGYGQGRWQRAVAKLDGSELDHWLSAASRRPG